MGTHRITVDLPNDVYRELCQSVDSGQYASVSEALQAALEARAADSHADAHKVEEWLQQTAIPIALRMEADPQAGFTGEEVLAHLEDDLRRLKIHSDAA